MTESIRTAKQVKAYGPRPCPSYGEGCTITAHVRWDDECRNGHNSFSITGEIRDPRVRRDRGIVACGCIHEEIAEAFPELVPFIKWHLSDARAPMHYPANALYLAGDRDCWGKRKGEPSSFAEFITFGDSPIRHKVSGKFFRFLENARKDGQTLEITAFEHKPDSSYAWKPKYTFVGFGAAWHECPFDTLREADEWRAAMQLPSVEFHRLPIAWSDGKERELDAAREAAVWPEATDDELMSDDLKDRLMARLPALMAEMELDITSLGFVW